MRQQGCEPSFVGAGYCPPDGYGRRAGNSPPLRVEASASAISSSPCNLCPRMCGARRDEGERGVCGADGRMMVARAALHFWEEPPLSGEAGSGAVFFSHCPLRCVYCQNAMIAAGEVGWEVDVERLAGICLDLQGQGALNVNFVTPTHYSLLVRDAVATARSRGLALPVVWNTSGYERVEVVEALADTVDVWLADFKYADPDLARECSRAADYPEVALSAIGKMVELAGEPTCDGRGRMTGGVIVRHLVLPGAVDNSKRALAALWERFGDAVLYSIMNQYTPVIDHPIFGRPTSPEEYEAVLDFADGLGIEDYFWQDGPAAAESFIPSWTGEGVLPDKTGNCHNC